jgi:hypothetical protein
LPHRHFHASDEQIGVYPKMPLASGEDSNMDAGFIHIFKVSVCSELFHWRWFLKNAWERKGSLPVGCD